MGCKQMDNNFSFTDLSLADTMEHNRSISRMEKINAIINWSSVEKMLLEHYNVGKKIEGADAHPPLLLLKCFLIQQWFHIESDPEPVPRTAARSVEAALSLDCATISIDNPNAPLSPF